jgi:hypothetical protein
MITVTHWHDRPAGAGARPGNLLASANPFSKPNENDALSAKFTFEIDSSLVVCTLGTLGQPVELFKE